MWADTIIHANSQKRKQIYLFRIDQRYNDSLHLKKFIPNKYFIVDTTSYFVLANFSQKPLTIRCINDQLLTEENCEFTDHIYKPIDVLIVGWCTTSVIRNSITLQPFDVLIFRDHNRISRNADALDKKTYLRLRTSTGTIRSPIYTKRINHSDFFLPLELKSDYQASYRQVVFKD